RYVSYRRHSHRRDSTLYGVMKEGRHDAHSRKILWNRAARWFVTNGGFLAWTVAQDTMGFVPGQGGAAAGSGVAESGESQRRAGVHVSGLEGLRSCERT